MKRLFGTDGIRAVAGAPPLDPPQVSAVFQGLRVAPNNALNVLPPAPNSGVLVLPTTIAPAARAICTAAIPPPPDAPCTSTISPFRRCAR